MSWKSSLADKLWNCRKWIALVSLVLALVAGIVIWSKTSNIIWTSISPFLIFLVPDLYAGHRYSRSIIHVIKLGVKQTTIDQMEKDKRIKRLLNLDELHRKVIQRCFKTRLLSVKYDGLKGTAPHIIMQVEFFNLSVFDCKVVEWELHTDPGTGEITATDAHTHYQLRPHKRTTDHHIEACSFSTIPLRVDIEIELSKMIYEIRSKGQRLQYHFGIDWKLALEDVGDQVYQDYLLHMSYV